MKVAYADFLHEEVKRVAPVGAVIMGVFATTSLTMALTNGEHKHLESESPEIKPNVLNFLMMAALALNISVCWFVSRKYPVATEFI